jgi:hypothetical protein
MIWDSPNADFCVQGHQSKNSKREFRDELSICASENPAQA